MYFDICIDMVWRMIAALCLLMMFVMALAQTKVEECYLDCDREYDDTMVVCNSGKFVANMITLSIVTARETQGVNS